MHRLHRLSDDEAGELRRWLDESPRHEAWMKKALDAERMARSRSVSGLFDEERAWQRLAVRMKASRRRSFVARRWTAVAAAVSLLLLLGGGYWLSGLYRNAAGRTTVADVPEIYAAKGDITLSCNGLEKALDSKEYAVTDTNLIPANAQAADEMLTISVARGNSFRVILDDSTEVCLNSDTKISFPRRFDDKSRDVTLWYGEAYFRVTRQEARPFLVHVQGSTIKVLGTTFNVNAYADERQLATTLVEGSVAFRSRNNRDFLLEPGMQSRMDLQTGDTQIEHVDTSLYTSWIKGRFIFQSMDLTAIMRQIERWYDVTADYRTEVTDQYHFRGMIDRDLSLQQVLDILEQVTDLTFTLDERTIIISK